MSSLSLREKDQTRVELLQALLRWRRAQLTRRDVGLLPRSGARTGHGLSQDDLAELTGYSVRIISQLEHGKLRSPSSDLLDAVCSGLRMTADERRTLWLLAAGTAPPPGPYATGADMGLARLVNQLYPHPAYVTDAVWDVEIYNKAVAEWFTDFSEIPVGSRNIAKWIFCDPHAQHVFVNWDRDFATVFLARMRAVVAEFPRDARLSALVSELRERSPYFERRWRDDAAVYVDPPSETRVFRRPGHTDPAQPDDNDYHVPIDMVILGALRPGDERRLVVFLLPDTEPHRSSIHSAQACAACARLAADG
jgi:transcriptional regulator with XRE-family HTH domain